MSVYQHYEGEFYQVLAEGKLVDTDELVIVYRHLNPEKPGVLVQTMTEFSRHVMNGDGDIVPRFRPVPPEELSEMIKAKLQQYRDNMLPKPAEQVGVPKDGNIAGINPHYTKGVQDDGDDE